MRPEEIWVIQIDPETTRRAPSSVVDTVDRRFEMSSNLSLNAELHWIWQVNQWIDERILPMSGFKLIKVARIQMSQELTDRLDLASKVERSPGYLHELMADGERQVDAFLQERQDPGAPGWEPMYPHRYRERQEKTIARAATDARQAGDRRPLSRDRNLPQDRPRYPWWRVNVVLNGLPRPAANQAFQELPGQGVAGRLGDPSHPDVRPALERIGKTDGEHAGRWPPRPHPARAPPDPIAEGSGGKFHPAQLIHHHDPADLGVRSGGRATRSKGC
jgi:hypothetical protein